MNVLLSIENNLASSIALRYLCRQSQKIPMFIQPLHIEEPSQRHYPFGAGWVRKTWEKTLVDATKNEIDLFIQAEAENCRGLARVKISVGEKEKEVLKELEGGFYDIFAMGLLSSFDSSAFYEMLRGPFLKKLTCPLLLVKNLTPFENILLLMDKEINIERLIPFYLKLYSNVPIGVSLVLYTSNDKDTVDVIEDSDATPLKEALSLLTSAGIRVERHEEVLGRADKVAQTLKGSGLVVSMFNKKGRKRPLTDVLASTPAPVLIFWE